jgi:hypothetical protein
MTQHDNRNMTDMEVYYIARIEALEQALKVEKQLTEYFREMVNDKENLYFPVVPLVLLDEGKCL